LAGCQPRFERQANVGKELETIIEPSRARKHACGVIRQIQVPVQVQVKLPRRTVPRKTISSLLLPPNCRVPRMTLLPLKTGSFLKAEDLVISVRPQLMTL